MKAEFVRDLNCTRAGVEQMLWNVGEAFYMSSAVKAPFDTARPETMVFSADEDGVVTDWEEVGVVFSLDHNAAMRAAGFEV